jgi:hypothetical protein
MASRRRCVKADVRDAAVSWMSPTARVSRAVGRSSDPADESKRRR